VTEGKCRASDESNYPPRSSLPIKDNERQMMMELLCRPWGILLSAATFFATARRRALNHIANPEDDRSA